MSITRDEIPRGMLPTPEGNDYSDGRMSTPPPHVIERPEPAPRENLSTEIWNLPNSLTLLRIFLVPVLVVVLLTKFSGRVFVGLAIFLVAAVTDFLDGYFARTRGQITRMGTLLDPIADKLLMSAAFISLVEMDPLHVPAWMLVIIIGREIAVSGLRLIAAQQGVTIAASPLGKGKMISQVVAISLLILGYELGELRLTGTVALWAVMMFALASGIDYFVKFARAIVSDRR